MAAINRTRCAHQSLKEGVLSHFIKDMGAYVSFSRFGAIKKAGSIKPYHQIRVMSHILSFLTGVTMPKLGDILVRGEVRAVVGAEQILQARAVDARLRLTDSIPINKAPQDQSIIGCGCAIQSSY